MVTVGVLLMFSLVAISCLTVESFVPIKSGGTQSGLSHLNKILQKNKDNSNEDDNNENNEENDIVIPPGLSDQISQQLSDQLSTNLLLQILSRLRATKSATNTFNKIEQDQLKMVASIKEKLQDEIKYLKAKEKAEENQTLGLISHFIATMMTVMTAVVINSTTTGSSLMAMAGMQLVAIFEEAVIAISVGDLPSSATESLTPEQQSQIANAATIVAITNSISSQMSSIARNGVTSASIDMIKQALEQLVATVG